MIFPPASAHPGTLHYIPPNLAAFEPARSLDSSHGINTVIWVGGMFDTFLSVTYPITIATALGHDWSVITTSLGSAGMSWGVSSIARDAEDMAKIVAYFRAQRPGGKVVIMGHSTGCQDCMEYLVGTGANKRPPVDGVILQGSVSDREALEDELPAAQMREANELARKMCSDGREKDVLPNRLTKAVFGRLAVTARRWIDVASPAPDHNGADDYFSSDLADERLETTFGKLPARAPLLVLYGGADESVPASIDKRALVQKWMHATERGGGVVDAIHGGVVADATHNLNGQNEHTVGDLVSRVKGFLSRLDAGELQPGNASGGARI